MPLRIGGKTIRLDRPAELPPDPKPGAQRLEVAIEHFAVYVMLDGKQILKAARTIDNIELVADLLSAYGYPEQATQLRKAKNIPRVPQ